MFGKQRPVNDQMTSSLWTVKPLTRNIFLSVNALVAFGQKEKKIRWLQSLFQAMAALTSS